MQEKHTCSGRNKPHTKGFSGGIASYILKDLLKCTCKASLFENGKWWCKRHAPSKVEEREAKAWNRYIAKIYKNVDNNE